MPALSFPSLPGITCSYPNLNRNPITTRISIHTSLDPPPELSSKLIVTSSNHSCSTAVDFLRKLSVSSIVLMGLGLGSLWAFSPPALACISLDSPSSEVQPEETFDDFEDEEMKAAFERWKSKSYALTVPIRVVSLTGSLPRVWIREFLRSQGKRVRFHGEFRQSLKDIFHELSNPFEKGEINPKSAVTADLVTIGDSWLNFAIDKGFIEPVGGAEDQDWFRDLSDKWKVYLRRSNEGILDSQGRIWAVPYRWGTMVIAYNKREFQRRKLAPIEDWSDLWRPELAGKISMVDSPREIVGAVLKCMGASYNTTNIDSQVVGGKNAVLQQLELLVQQVRLFDSQQYLKIFKTGDVWVTVGWSSDVIPTAKTMSNVSVIVPKSGASLWADFWAIPTTSRLVTDQIGGRVRGPSPMVQQWLEFCLQPARALPFTEEVIPGASPISLKASAVEPQEKRGKGISTLDTNLVGNVPPGEILSRCEFLEPLSEDAFSDYQWLIGKLQKPSQSIINRLRLSITKPVTNLWLKMQSKTA